MKILRPENPLVRLLNPNITAVLIKGLPGAGKTTLALELISLHGKGIYVSTRVSEEKLVRQYPHIKELLEAGKFIEVASNREIRSFEDLRFGRADNIVESVIEAVTKLKEPLIVLDSWDALAKELEFKERLRVEKSLVGIAEANRSKIVFVSEEPHLTTTDYLVDAIVTLKDEEFEGRRIRRLEWNKLRGLPIPQKRHLFTLIEGRFRILETANRPKGIKPRKFKPIKHKKGRFSLGSEDLDAMIGNGEKGSVVLLEIGKGLSFKLYYPIPLTITLNFLSQGGCAMIIPSASVSPQTVKSSVLEYLDKDVVEERLRIGSYEEPEGSCFFRLDRMSIDRNLKIVNEKVREMKKDAPCIYFIGADTLEFLHGTEDMVDFMLKLGRKVRTAGGLLVIVAKHSVKGLEELSDISDVRTRLELVDGTLISYLVKPARPTICGVTFDFSKGYPRVRLMEVV